MYAGSPQHHAISNQRVMKLPAKRQHIHQGTNGRIDERMDVQLPLSSNPASRSRNECSQLVHWFMTAFHLCCCDISVFVDVKYPCTRKTHTRSCRMHRLAAMPYPWISMCSRPWQRPIHVCSVYIGEQGMKLELAERGSVL